MLRNSLYNYLINSNTRFAVAEESNSVRSSTLRTTDSNVEILSAFLASDKDNDGLLDQEEFVGLVAELESMEITSQKQQIWFSEIDTNNDGFIDFEEFAAWWCRLQENRERYL